MIRQDVSNSASWYCRRVITVGAYGLPKAPVFQSVLYVHADSVSWLPQLWSSPLLFSLPFPWQGPHLDTLSTHELAAPLIGYIPTSQPQLPSPAPLANSPVPLSHRSGKSQAWKNPTLQFLYATGGHHSTWQDHQIINCWSSVPADFSATWSFVPPQ